MRYFLSAILTLATLLAPVFAQAEEPAAPAAETSALDALSTTLTVGYDSRYVLYGYRLSRNLWHADVFFYYPLSERWSVTAGSWYGYLTDGTYNEVDVYGGLDYALTETLSVGTQYSLFNYLEVPFETSDQVHELAVHVTYADGPFYLSLRDHYDNGADGHLLRGLAAYNRDLVGKLGLSLNAEAGYAFGYFIEGNLPNHALFTARFPYALSDAVGLSAFVARTIPLAAIDSFEKDETYGGASFSLSF